MARVPRRAVVVLSNGSGDDDDKKKKKGNGPALVRRVGRVTVILPKS